MKYYAIRKGRTNNTIVTTWAECSNLVDKYQGAEYKAFGDVRDAEQYLSGNTLSDTTLGNICEATGCELNSKGKCTKKFITINKEGRCANY